MTGHILAYGFGLAVFVVQMAIGPPSTAAQDIPGATPPRGDTLHLNLADAVHRALDDNPGLKAAAERSDAADHAASAAFRRHFGDLQATAWASRYSDAQLVRPMSQDLLTGGLANLPFAQDQVHYGLTYQLPLFLGGRILALSHLARLKADEAGALLEGTRWQVRANVTATYAALQALSAVTDAYRAEVASLLQTHARVQLMVQQGKRPEVDLLEITDALEEARAKLADVEAQSTHVRALLLALIDYPADQTVAFDPLPDRFATLPTEELDWDAMVGAASPVTAATLRARQATSGKHAALADFLPKVSLGAGLWENAGTGVEGQEQTWELKLQASIPIFTGGRNAAAYQSAAANERAADLALRQTLLERRAEIRGSLARFRAAQDALDAAGKRVAATDEAARIEALRYDNGAGTIDDLLRARTRAAEAEAFLAKSKGDVLSVAAQINALVEREVVRDFAPDNQEED